MSQRLDVVAAVAVDRSMPVLRLDGLAPLFHTPLGSFHIADSEPMNGALVAEALALRTASPGRLRSNQNGWHSEDDFFDRCEPGCRMLQAHLLDAVRQATLGISPGFDFASQAAQFQGWINVHERGGYHAPHDHPGWAWSGCYYARVPGGAKGRSGCIEFLDGRTNLHVPTVVGASCFQSKFMVRPQAGMLLVFPSWLRHWVYPHDGDSLRVSVAFNARFLPHSRPS